METITSCNTATLAGYTPTGDNPWDMAKAKHLYRRLGYGAIDATINLALAGTPQSAVDTLMNEAINMPNTPAPEWGYWSFNDYADYNEMTNEQRGIWYRQAAKDIQTKGLKGRLTFFWLNHFVTQLESYNHPPYMFQYWDALQTHCLGNFKTFIREIGLNPAMLLMLNGFENTNNNPNENYARELYELFSLGENNGYTQQDIEETSRALTGYNHWDDYGGAIYFDESTFDNSLKTILGLTGNWGYDDVIDILFEQRGDAIATFICEKLYKYFVSPVVNETVISSLKATFIATDWEIAPVLNSLFRSEHFFDVNANGHLIKSPYDLTATYINELNMTYESTEEDHLNFIVYINDMLGQDLFQPIDVGGWQRDQDWINTSTLTGRWLGMEYLTWPFWDYDRDQFRQFAINLTGNSNDPEFITRTIVDYFISKQLYTASEYDIAIDIFKWEVPQGYYDDGSWNLSWENTDYQVLLLIHHIFRMPEFQLK